MKNKVTIKLMGSNTLLTLAFFIAKITGYINWSWIWVFCPMWIPFVIFAMVLGFAIFMSLLAAVIK